MSKKMKDDMQHRLNLKMSTRILLLLCMMGAGLMIASAVILLLRMMGDLDLLVAQSIQAVILFILPAMVAMMLFYQRPLHVMGLDRAPSLKALALVITFYVVSLPAMNWIVAANQAMHLPSWLSALEYAMRVAEEQAATLTADLLNVNTVGRLIVVLLVVGFLTGLSEEMFFRGAMLRTMQDSRLGKHAVVWITAIVFSALHMQFFGFFPRMLLGAWLGYLLVWTRSLWVPIIAHTLNNGTVVLVSYLANKGVVPDGFGDNLGVPADGSFPWLPLLSLVLSVAIAVWAARSFRRDDAGV